MSLAAYQDFDHVETDSERRAVEVGKPKIKPKGWGDLKRDAGVKSAGCRIL